MEASVAAVVVCPFKTRREQQVLILPKVATAVEVAAATAKAVATVDSRAATAVSRAVMAANRVATAASRAVC